MNKFQVGQKVVLKTGDEMDGSIGMVQNISEDTFYEGTNYLVNVGNLSFLWYAPHELASDEHHLLTYREGKELS